MNLTIRLFCLAAMFVSLPVSAAGTVAGKSLVTVSEDVSGNGEQLYKNHCEVCHGGSVAKAPALTLLNLMSASSVYRALDQGIMQQQAKVLTDSEKVAVAEYLTGQGLEQQALAPAPQCEGKAAQFDYDQPPISSGWGVDNSNQRHYGDSITSINASNIDQLELSWAFAYPDAIRARSQPSLAALFILVVKMVRYLRLIRTLAVFDGHSTRWLKYVPR